MKNKLVPALIGGVTIFVVSFLVSLIPRAGCCACLLAILGGVLAAYLYIRNSATPVSNAEGLVVGALAGLITGALRLVYLAITLLVSREGVGTLLQQVQERILRQAGVNFNENWLVIIILAGVILGVLLLVFLEAIGGAIGVALFEKRKGETISPPPPPMPPPPAPPDANNLPSSAPGL